MTVVALIEDPAELTKIIEWAKNQEQEPLLSVCALSPPELALVPVKNLQDRHLFGEGYFHSNDAYTA